MDSLKKNEVMALLSIFAAPYAKSSLVIATKNNGSVTSDKVSTLEVASDGVFLGGSLISYSDLRKITMDRGQLEFSPFCIRVTTREVIFSMSPLSNPIIEVQDKYYPIVRDNI